MIQKKICMLGAFAAGKTSLVSRFVSNTFSEKYLTTVGVRIERKAVRTGDRELDLILWDLHGEDEFQAVRTSYLRGSAGCILVVDGTRPATLDTALRLHHVARTTLGEVPCVYALNKADLADAWALDDAVVHALRGSRVIRTSAKTGLGIDEAFSALVGTITGQ
jgi:small GTP-binding protein